MANDNERSSSSSKGVNPLATGVAGAIIGAAAGVAAMALSDEKNRKKAEKVLGDLEKEGNKVFKEVTRIAMELKDKGIKALPKAKVKKAAKKAKKK